VAWGRTAEVIDRYVTKGRLLGIEGKLEYRNYENENGEKRYFTEIRANEVLLLDKK
jgi:single-strand DNA-binding protein